MQVPYQPYPSREPEDVKVRTPDIKASPEMFGAAVGRGLSSIGAGFENISNELAKVQNLQDEIAMNKLTIDTDVKQNEEVLRFSQLPPDQAATQLPSHIDTLRQIQEGPLSGMTPNQQRIYLGQTRWKTEGFIGSSTRYAVGAQRKAAVDSINTSILTTRDRIAANPDDPAIVSQGLAEMTENYRKLLQTDGTPSATAMEKFKFLLGRDIKHITAEVARKNPGRAFDILEVHRNDINAQAYTDAWNKVRDYELSAIAAHDQEVLRTQKLGLPPPAPLPFTPNLDRKPTPFDPEKQSDAGPLTSHFAKLAQIADNPAQQAITSSIRRTGAREVINSAANAWQAEGMSVNGVRGVLANVEDESGFNPTLRHPDQPQEVGESRFAHGLYQEGGAEWRRYASWLKDNHPGADWRDHRLQSEFAAKNLRENYPNTWRRMVNAKSANEAATIYLREYLKPASHHQASRSAKYARGVSTYGVY